MNDKKEAWADLNAKLQKGLDSPLTGHDTTDILNRVKAEKETRGTKRELP